MIPRFAVVGHPNKGKSSIVATLSENRNIAIGPIPGTTTHADQFTLTVNGEALYTLIDTPGFQRSGEVLRWLQANVRDASNRRETVAEFVSTFADDDRFHDERELLTPILDGAGILYVVDGAKPYGAEYEIEMQILQWTGQPRMALINMIGDGDYEAQWRQALDQYFSIVRRFDAMHADFTTRINLLRGFAELDEQWRSPLSNAVDALQAERLRQLERSANEITNLLYVALTATTEEGASGNERERPAQEARLEDKLMAKLRDREKNARDTIQSIYHHQRTQREELELKIVSDDLFSDEAWEIFGLSRMQLIATGGISGAVAGGGLDLIVGGTSLFAGAVGGAIIGSLSAWLGSDTLAKVKVLGQPLGGDLLRVGPVQARNFPWVVLGRAYVHHAIVSERNHAQREAISTLVHKDHDLYGSISTSERNTFEALFTKIRDNDASTQVREDLVRSVIALLGIPVSADGQSSEPQA